MEIGIFIMQVIIGVIVTVYIIHSCRESNRIFRESTVPIRATIINIVQEQHSRIRPSTSDHNFSSSRNETYYTYDPIVSFKYQGKEYVVQAYTNNVLPNRFVVGDEVVILVNPNNPSEINLKPSMNKQFSEENEHRLRYELNPNYEEDNKRAMGGIKGFIIFSLAWGGLILFLILLFSITNG